VKSDEQLIACYRESGRAEALDTLTERYLGRVRAMIYPMVLDKTLADDLTQEVFLRAFRGLPSFDGRAQFSTWAVPGGDEYDLRLPRTAEPLARGLPRHAARWLPVTRRAARLGCNAE